MIAELLTTGFGYHDTQSERLADELETVTMEPVDAVHWVRLLHISNHTIGEHLGDWDRAQRLAERVLDGRTANAETSPAWARLATARFLAGDVLGSIAAEIEALRAASDIRGGYIDAKISLAVGLLGSGRIDDGAALYEVVLAMADALTPSPTDRGIAVASNNLASDLLEMTNRLPAQDRLMVRASEAAYVFWRKAGTWVNEERALYLKALVSNSLGNPSGALIHADAALGLIAANGSEPVDVVFLTLARANSLRLLSDESGFAAALSVADAGAAAWDDEGLQAWYAEERAKVAGTIVPE